MIWNHGVTWGKDIMIRCDGEPAIEQVRDALSRYLGGTVTPEGPPPGEKQANGCVEEAGKTIRDIMRVYKVQLEAGVGKLEEKEVIMQWLARWAVMSYNRYQRGTDGKTPCQRQTGRWCKNEVVPFGEKVWFRPLRRSGDKKNIMNINCI